MYVILIIMTTFQIGIVLFIIEKLRILVYHFFLQPRDPCLPWRGTLGPEHTPR